MASVINALIVTGPRLAGSEVSTGTREIALVVEGFRFVPITNVARGVLSLSDGDARLVDGFYELTQGVAVWAQGSIAWQTRALHPQRVLRR
jgi:hypothetical protein